MPVSDPLDASGPMDEEVNLPLGKTTLRSTKKVVKGRLVKHFQTLLDFGFIMRVAAPATVSMLTRQAERLLREIRHSGCFLPTQLPNDALGFVIGESGFLRTF
jgi:hypothetical protein